MTKLLLYISLFVSFFATGYASPYGAKLCKNDPRFYCVKVGNNAAWKAVKAAEKERPELKELLARINRVNVGLYGTIAVPKDLSHATLLNTAPFPERMPAALKRLLVIDLGQLAWGAYDVWGNLVKWGPISPGKAWCPDIKSSCHTEIGSFTVYRKGGADCKSTKYPIPDGGAPMPYCMFFNGGIALHAGKLPGHPDSHGCVRVTEDDAEWLSRHFIKLGTPIEVRDIHTQFMLSNN